MTHENKQQELITIFEETELLDQHIDVPLLLDFTNEGDLRDYIQERINEYGVIYTGDAMKYLLEYDPSLTDSLELASDLGFDFKDLSSETLATLHIQNAMSEEQGGLDLSKLFEDISEE